MVRPERCVLLASESLARVSAGALGSRPQPGGEILWARAGRQKPLRREQRSGPQQPVNATASSDYHPKGVREGRDAHITAKATDSRPDRNDGWTSPGSQAAARLERRMRNRRGPPRQPTSGQDRAYKAGRLKSHGAGRESEGFVVPRKACKITRWREGTLLWSGWPGGKREGMAARPNHPSYKRDNSTEDTSYGHVPNRMRATADVGLSAAGATPRRAPASRKAMRAVHVVSGRPSVSRMRENRTYGLKGGS
jgi:hypothetical protein